MKIKLGHIFFLFPVFLVSCISRLERPEITGVVLDYKNKPIADCIVGETKTNNEGEFVLPEMRGNKFFLSEIIAMEAPPLFIHEAITKDGFESDAFVYFSRFGGGQSKGAKFNIGAIYLRMKNEKINIQHILQKDWLCSATKNLDTLFFVNQQLPEFYQTEKFTSFYNTYEKYTDNYLHSFGPNNLPNGVIRKKINVHFEKNQDFRTTKIIQYGNKEGAKSNDSYPANDTLKYSGRWIQSNDSTLQFITDDEELNHKYKIIHSDLSFLKLKKI
jgi:hypothetical protein